MDYRSLAQSLVSNGQAHLSPNDVIRQAVVVGYDPNYTGSGHDYPMISIQIAGDDTPCHGIRFAETYTPNLGDTVWVVLSGEDGWVMSKLSDIPNGNGTTRSPSTPGVIGHGNFSDTTVLASSGAQTKLIQTGITTPLLPNRLYKIEANFSFSVTNASPTDTVTGDLTKDSATITNVSDTTGFAAGASIQGDSIPLNTTIVSVTSNTITMSAAATKAKTGVAITISSSHYAAYGILTPSGYQEIHLANVVNGSYTRSGHTTWYNQNHSGNYPNSWTGSYPGATFKWYLVGVASATGDTPPAVTSKTQNIVIYDLGIAS
jgi:hypothetical protein